MNFTKLDFRKNIKGKKLSFDYEDESLSYLGDGIYADWSNFETNEEYEQKVLCNQKKASLAERLKIEWLDSVDKPIYNASELLNSMFRDTVRKGVLLAAKRFCRVESIKSKYADAIYWDCNPSDIIAPKFRRYNLFKSVEEIRRLDFLIKELKEHRCDLTSYFKVHEIQIFIHREMKLKNGIDSHLSMDKLLMREVLSIFRLFFITSEARKMNFEGFISFLIKNKETIEHAKSFIPQYIIDSSAQHNRNWSSRHQHSLLYYLPVDMRDFIKKLVQLRFIETKSIIRDEVKNTITKYHIAL